MRRFLPLVLLAFSHAAFAGDAPKTVTVPEGNAIVGTDRNALKSQLINPRAKPQWYLDETPQRTVAVKAFAIDTHEVTNAEYKKIFPLHAYPKNIEQHPVVNVSWQDAADYCEEVGGRLPTETEWERAARGDAGNVYPWGNEFDPAKTVYVETSGNAGSKVGSFELESSGSGSLGGSKPVGSPEGGKSPFGLYDMAGNAWEWVDGWYDEKKKLRLLKGGSWLTPAESVRSAARLGDEANARFNDYGFRCAYNSDR